MNWNRLLKRNSSTDKTAASVISQNFWILVKHKPRYQVQLLLLTAMMEWQLLGQKAVARASFIVQHEGDVWAPFPAPWSSHGTSFNGKSLHLNSELHCATGGMWQLQSKAQWALGPLVVIQLRPWSWVRSRELGTVYEASTCTGKAKLLCKFHPLNAWVVL